MHEFGRIGAPPRDIAVEVISCRVLRSLMHRNGWGYAASEKEADAELALARRSYDAVYKPPITDAELVQSFR